MKKILLVAFVAVLTLTATSHVDAQTNFISQYGKTLDTTFTGFLTKDLTIGNQVTSASNIVEIQFTATKISGTVGGTVTVQTSLDGVDWYTAHGTSVYTLTDGTQTTSFKITNYGARYLRIRTVGTGTMSAQIKAAYVGRKLSILRT